MAGSPRWATFCGACALVGWMTAVGRGDEVHGVLKRVDPNKQTVVVSVDGKDKPFVVNKDASIVEVRTVPGKNGKSSDKLTTVESGIAGLSVGANVALLTETVDGKVAVTSIKSTPESKSGKTTQPAAKKKKKKLS